MILGTYVFGLMGSYYPPPEVYAQGATCSIAGNQTTCQVTLTNQGGHDTATTGSCSDGSSAQAAVVGGGTIPAGGSLEGVKCVSQGTTLSGSSHIQGWLSLTDGGIVIFFGTLV